MLQTYADTRKDSCQQKPLTLTFTVQLGDLEFSCSTGSYTHTDPLLYLVTLGATALKNIHLSWINNTAGASGEQGNDANLPGRAINCAKNAR